jgi:hypothetical protein
VTPDNQPTAEEVTSMAETMGRIEIRFAWRHLDPELQRVFASRLADVLPAFDPASRWESMTVGNRREWIWHETQTPEEFRAVWDTDAEQLRAAADDATAEAFRSIGDLEPAR